MILNHFSFNLLNERNWISYFESLCVMCSTELVTWVRKCLKFTWKGRKEIYEPATISLSFTVHPGINIASKCILK